MEIIINAGNTSSTESRYMEERLCINSIPYKICVVGWTPYVAARIKSIFAVTGLDIRQGTFDLIRSILEKEGFEIKVYSVTVTTFRVVANDGKDVEVFANFKWGQIIVSAECSKTAMKIRDEIITVANISDDNEPDLKLMKIVGELLQNIHGVSIQSLDVTVGQEEEVEF